MPFMFGTQVQGLLDDEEKKQELNDEWKDKLAFFKNTSNDGDTSGQIVFTSKKDTRRRNKGKTTTKIRKKDQVVGKKDTQRKFGSLNKEILRLDKLKANDSYAENSAENELNDMKYLYNKDEWDDVQKLILNSIPSHKNRPSQRLSQSESFFWDSQSQVIEDDTNQQLLNRNEDGVCELNHEELRALYDIDGNKEFAVSADENSSINGGEGDAQISGVFTLSQVLGETQQRKFSESKFATEVIEIVSDSMGESDGENSIIDSEYLTKKQNEVIEICNTTDDENENGESLIILDTKEKEVINVKEKEVIDVNDITIPDSEYSEEEDGCYDEAIFVTAPEFPAESNAESNEDNNRMAYFKGWKIPELKKQLNIWGIKGVSKLNKNGLLEEMNNIVQNVKHDKWIWCLNKSNAAEEKYLNFKGWDNDDEIVFEKIDMYGKIKEFLETNNTVRYNILTFKPLNVNLLKDELSEEGIDKADVCNVLDSMGICWIDK